MGARRRGLRDGEEAKKRNDPTGCSLGQRSVMVVRSISISNAFAEAFMG